MTEVSGPTPSELTMGGAAVAASAVAVVVTLDSSFLAHPGWLAAWQANFIVGPVLVGLYWRRSRPDSRFGARLVALGLLALPLILLGLSGGWPSTIGVLWGGVYSLALLAIILAFPTGRVHGFPSVVILAFAALTLLTTFVPSLLVSPQLARGSIASCREACPDNAFFVSARPGLEGTLRDWQMRAGVVLLLATLAVLGRRFAHGARPRRRTLLAGESVAAAFLLAGAAYHAQVLLAPSATRLHAILQWTYVAAAGFLAYGFLLALVAAELFAARVLRAVVIDSLRRPSPSELEQLLRAPLDDRNMRLAFRRHQEAPWTDVHGAELHRELQPDDSDVTYIEFAGRPAAAIIHDPQLEDEPELLGAAGTAVLLELARADSEQQLRGSRARIASARDNERRRIEQDLHDGAQQALFALSVRIGQAVAMSDGKEPLRRELRAAEHELDDAITELRELAHGIYPSLLATSGLEAALEAVARQSAAPVELVQTGIRRPPSDLEAALYFVCREAIDNAAKHGGRGTRVRVELREGDEAWVAEITDSGQGFDRQRAVEGAGLRAMHDRIEAAGGELDITSSPGDGVRIVAAVPKRDPA